MNADQLNIIKNTLNGIKITIPLKQEIINKDHSNKNYGLEYYYESEEDMKDAEHGGKNLPRRQRPWGTYKEITTSNGQTFETTLSGLTAFNNLIYNPRDMYNYIDQYFIKPFAKNPDKNPFVFAKNYKYKTVNDLKTLNDLGPHQKFCGQFMSNMTDFNGILIYHGLGSGKTLTDIVIAESNKASFVNSKGNITNIPGRNNACTVTIAVPPNMLDTYFKTLTGDMKSGKYTAWTSLCVIYSADENGGYRQYYTGTVKKDSNGNTVKKNGLVVYEDETLQKITDKEFRKNQLKKEEAKLEEEYKRINSGSGLSTTEKNDLLNKNFQKKKDISDKIKGLTSEIKTLNDGLKDRVDNVYFLVSFYTLVTRLIENGYAKETMTRNEWGTFPEGAKYGTPPHTDCFHSPNSVLIIDEIHKFVSENSTKSSDKGKYHEAAYNIVNFYARLRDGFPAMKIILSSATPIADRPSQLGNVINLLRPRIPFPTKQADFEKWFVRNDLDIKNSMLFRYMLSGYVSYFKGGNPKGYPYRRNHIMLHPITSIQSNIYIKRVSKALENKKNNEKGIFTSAISDLLCVFPGQEKTVVTQEGSKSEDYNKAYSMYLTMLDIKKKKGLEEVGIFFKKHSIKLYEIAQLLMNSKGNSFVYSSFIARGLLPLAYFLMVNDFHHISRNEVGQGLENSFGFYSGEDTQLGLKELGKMNKQKLIDLFNEPSNKDGSKCRFILGNITEGISFQNVQAVHICEPWWNGSKLEQVIGRGIRYLSHTELPENRQYVDVYYHTAVLNSFPLSTKELSGNFSRMSSDQIMYKITERKTRLNTDFGQLTKESAIDTQLNENGNLTRLEEVIVYKSTKKNGEYEQNFSTFLNRSSDKNYEYISRDITEVEMITEEREIVRNHVEKDEFDITELLGLEEEGEGPGALEVKILNSIGENDIWPAIGYKVGDKKLTDYQFSESVDNRGRKMISVIVQEIIEDFSRKTNMDFYQLKNYAIQNGEDEWVWNAAQDAYAKNQLISYMIGIHGIYKMDPNSLEMKNFLNTYANYFWQILPIEMKKNLPDIKDYEQNIASLIQLHIRAELPGIVQLFNNSHQRQITENDVSTQDKLKTNFNMDEIKFLARSIMKKKP